MATKKAIVKKGDIKTEIKKAVPISEIKNPFKEKLLEGNKNFSSEVLGNDSKISKRSLIIKEVINRVPSILKGNEETFIVKDILSDKIEAKYIASSLLGKIKGLLSEKLEKSFIVLNKNKGNKKTEVFTIRLAEKLVK